MWPSASDDTVALASGTFYDLSHRMAFSADAMLANRCRRRDVLIGQRRADEHVRRRDAVCEKKIPLVLLAGKEYGSGSSRDWAAKGPKLLGVRAVIAESFERIHRSNLVGMGILPLQFEAGQNVESLGLTGEEICEFTGLRAMLDRKFANGRTLTVQVKATDGKTKKFTATVRIDTPQEILYYQHGGILLYVLRQLAGKA